MNHPPDRPIAAFLALGSNLGDRAAALRQAIARLGEVDETRVAAVSPVYETETHVQPGQPPQPDHLNAVVRLETRLPPAELLGHLQRIEREAGREPSERWAPRPLDLDLLLYGDAAVRLRSPFGSLTVPHPRLPERRFVLQPLADLAPDALVPELDATVAELLARCPDPARLEPTDLDLQPPAAPRDA